MPGRTKYLLRRLAAAALFLPHPSSSPARKPAFPSSASRTLHRPAPTQPDPRNPPSLGTPAKRSRPRRSFAQAPARHPHVPAHALAAGRSATRLLAAQQNPASPSFHQWLSPQQFGDRFGFAPSDLAKVAAWLQSMGLTVVEIPASGNFLVFEGTAARRKRRISHRDSQLRSERPKFFREFLRAVRPGRAAGLVAGFRGLNSVRLQPRAVPSKIANAPVQPDFTSSLTGTTYITPADFATIYDLNPLYCFLSAYRRHGPKNRRRRPIPDSPRRHRRVSLSIPACLPNAPQTILVPSSPNPGIVNGDVQESSLDIEWSGAVAPGASILFVYSGSGVMDALQYAISQNLAPIISISYGSCEALHPPGEIQTLAYLAQQANAQGITIVSSAGDSGATDCDGSVTRQISPRNSASALIFPPAFPMSPPSAAPNSTRATASTGTPPQQRRAFLGPLLYPRNRAWNDSPS